MDIQLTLTQEEADELFSLLAFHQDMLDEDDDRVEVVESLFDKVASL